MEKLLSKLEDLRNASKEEVINYLFNYAIVVLGEPTAPSPDRNKTLSRIVQHHYLTFHPCIIVLPVDARNLMAYFSSCQARSRRAVIRQEADSHAEYGVVAEETLALQIRDANYSTGKVKRKVAAKGSIS